MKTTIKQSVMVVSTAPDRIWLDLGFDPSDEDEVSFHKLIDVTWSHDNASGYGVEYVRVDTTPPQREWVGLTDKEKNGCLVSADPCECLATPEAQQLMEDVEAKLKEKNG